MVHCSTICLLQYYLGIPKEILKKDYIKRKLSGTAHHTEVWVTPDVDMVQYFTTTKSKGKRCVLLWTSYKNTANLGKFLEVVKP